MSELPGDEGGLARPEAEVVVRGLGKPGYCSLCAWEHAAKLNKGIRDGWNSTQASEFAGKLGKTFNRRTFYSHKPHAISPEQRVIQFAEQGSKALTIRKTSNTSFLESLRDIGYSKAIDDPDQISIEHALKAVSILEGRKDKGGDQINLLVLISTGHRPPMEIIEGEARDVT